MKNKYMETIHKEGKIWMLGALFLFLSLPIIISIVTGVWPPLNYFLVGFFATAAIFWPVTTIEVFTFSPMIGSASYLAFVTGNLSSMKVPAAINAQNALGIEKGSEDAEVISMIAVASSSITTTLIIIIGILLLDPLTPILESTALSPAFDNILPALFGALGVAFISKRWKLSIIPLVFMLIFFAFVPGSGGLVGIMVPVGVILTVSCAYIFHKKGWI
ncbi:MAG: hypothetical protein WCR19_05165 [Acholeplasmataceae bacterium]